MATNIQKTRQRGVLQNTLPNQTLASSGAGPAGAGGSAAAERSGQTGGAGGVARDAGGGLAQTHSPEDNFGTKAPFDDGDRLWSVENVAKDFGVSVRVASDFFGALDAALGEVVVQRDCTALATETGLKKIRALIAGAMRPAVAGAEAPPAREDLTVVRVRGMKRLTARRASGAMVVCEIQSTEKLMPGMILKGCTRGWGGVWRFTGKLPRKKGRW